MVIGDSRPPAEGRRCCYQGRIDILAGSETGTNLYRRYRSDALHEVDAALSPNRAEPFENAFDRSDATICLRLLALKIAKSGP
jgi:hypothetical protein